MPAPLVEMRSVCKHFGGVRAVDAVSLYLEEGEVLGVLGHNGAGKSTLIRLLSGAQQLDAGEIIIAGEPVRFRSPRDARAWGIETLYQNLALADNLDASANLFLGRELRTRFGLLDDVAMERATRAAIHAVNPAFRDFRSPVDSLSGGERQTVAIARAVHFRARVVILDEPTAALGPAETKNVSTRISRLREAGIGVILVSHDLHDVLALADRVVVMKSGSVIATRTTANLSPDELLQIVVSGSSDLAPA